jgi:hypothetical protein
METAEAIALLEEALARMKRHDPHPDSGLNTHLGGVYWRLARVLADHVDPRLEAAQTPGHARFLRFHHGVIVRPPPKTG